MKQHEDTSQGREIRKSRVESKRTMRGKISVEFEKKKGRIVENQEGSKKF
jgi:hypothetical protein